MNSASNTPIIRQLTRAWNHPLGPGAGFPSTDMNLAKPMTPKKPLTTTVKALLVSAVTLAIAPGAFAAKPQKYTPEQIEFFEKKIRPVLAEKCYDCHSEQSGKMKGDLVLDSRDGIRVGGERGPGIVPGKPDESFVIQAIRGTGRISMPPEKKGGQLPEEVVADFEKWVSIDRKSVV